MTPQENQALQEFLNQLTQVNGIVKDPQADALISRAVAQQPDAAYLLVQRALLMEQALNTAKSQITSLQAQLQAAPSAPSSGFLDAANAWGNHAVSASRPVPATSVASAPTYPSTQTVPGPAMQNPVAAAPGFLSGRGGSMLGTIAATAAGVAGGAFLFQGIENLMSPHHSGSGLLNQSATPPALAPGMAPSASTTESDKVANHDTSESNHLIDESASDSLFDDSFADDDSSIV